MHFGNMDILITPEAPKITGMQRLMTLLRKNPRYWPNVGAVFLIVPTFAAVSLYHTFKGPEVVLKHHSNPEPWQQYDHKQYHFYSPIDHQKYEHPRPKF